MLQKLRLVLVSLALAGCAAMDEPAPPLSVAESQADAQAMIESSSKPKVDASAPLESSASDLARANQQATESAEPVLYRGNDRQVRLPTASEPVRFVGEDVSLNFEKAPLSEVVHAIVGDILALDYLIDGPIPGEVTLRTRTPIPRNELLGVLESLLKANNTIMIRGKENRFLITSDKQAVSLSPGINNPRSDSPGFSTIVVPLQYISATNMAEILLPVAGEAGLVRADNTRNILMLAGTQEQISGWLEIISTFDVDMLKGMSVGLFPLENGAVEEVALGLTNLLSAGGGEGAQGGNLGQLIRIIPFKRLNSILVVTPRAHYLDTVATWIERLDASPNSAFEKRLFVYPVQNTTANRLAQLLNNIYSGSGSGGGTGGARQGVGRQGAGGVIGSGAGGQSAPGMSFESIGNASGAATGAIASGAAGGGITAMSMNGGGEESPLDDVRVVADDENNALMIYATGKQYGVISDALDQLDVVATQVIIEASILEVTLTDDLRYGLEWTFKNGFDTGNGYDGTGLFTSTPDGPSPLTPGFSYTITNSIGNVSAVLNALSEESLVNVISTPSVMVLDNHTAYIHVGQQVPVSSGSTVTSGGNVTESVEYRDTGVKLNVRPSVNAGGLVTMDIEQSVTDVGPVEFDRNRRFLERNIMSRVAVRSSESVVLGGLIRENATNSDAGVPFLHKVPIVGSLFGTTEKTDTRTELLVIITPRAIYNEDELRKVSDEMRAQIRHMELIDPPE
ncbi:MAG: type II secretion system secretin GspD [Halioglobus sp.]